MKADELFHILRAAFEADHGVENLPVYAKPPGPPAGALMEVTDVQLHDDQVVLVLAHRWTGA